RRRQSRGYLNREESALCATGTGPCPQISSAAAGQSGESRCAKRHPDELGVNLTMPVLLFGASKAGECFLNQHPELEVVGFVDNDPTRQGSTYLGKTVFSPQAISTLTFDRVIITSQWADAIRTQLVEEIGIADNLIEVPAKQQVKAALPFQ